MQKCASVVNTCQQKRYELYIKLGWCALSPYTTRLLKTNIFLRMFSHTSLQRTPYIVWVAYATVLWWPVGLSRRNSVHDRHSKWRFIFVYLLVHTCRNHSDVNIHAVEYPAGISGDSEDRTLFRACNVMKWSHLKACSVLLLLCVFPECLSWYIAIVRHIVRLMSI